MTKDKQSAYEIDDTKPNMADQLQSFITPVDYA